MYNTLLTLLPSVPCLQFLWRVCTCLCIRQLLLLKGFACIIKPLSDPSLYIYIYPLWLLTHYFQSVDFMVHFYNSLSRYPRLFMLCFVFPFIWFPVLVFICVYGPLPYTDNKVEQWRILQRFQNLLIKWIWKNYLIKWIKYRKYILNSQWEIERYHGVYSDLGISTPAGRVKLWSQIYFFIFVLYLTKLTISQTIRCWQIWW